MANLNTTLQIKTGQGDSFDMLMSDQYTEVYRTQAKVDNTDGFISLASLSKTNASILKGAKLLVIKNNSPVGVEILFHINEFATNGVSDTYSADALYTQFLAGGEFMVLPNQFIIGSNGITSVANAVTVSNLTGAAHNATLAVDSLADVDSATADGIVNSASATRVYLEPYTSAANCTANLFVVGDLIRVDDEIMEVTAIGDKSDLANNYLDVTRGMYGSTATTGSADDEPVEFPFFNTQGNFDDYTLAQTNQSGRYSAKNLLGHGRKADSTKKTGIVRGSFAMKFYNQGYQELGLSGVTGSSKSGLVASTAYQFQVAVDGGSAYDVDITTDASDLTVGKLLNLIQSQFDQAYYASSGNLKNKKLTVGIVNGDIRFTSGSRTSTSAVALSDSSGGDTDLWGVGIIPAVASVETAVPSKLPDDTIIDKDTYNEETNMPVFAYDDGKGNILGAANGTINYHTGEIDFTAEPNAEFAVSLNHSSALSGGIVSDSNLENCIIAIKGRSTNSKINAEVEILGFV
tara:strand:+ start:10314 stop:11870 length:1557 start_codon:yes stop_codon:yes gene_type:complete